MTTWRRWLAAVAVLLGALGGTHAEEPEATAVVKHLNDTLLGVLKDAQRLGYEGRRARLAPAVDAAYDVPFMAEKALGRHWKTLSDADRARWISLSRQFSTANYAANFDHWSGQTIDLLGQDAAASDTVIVRTHINDPEGEGVDMSYRLHRTEQGWRIIDVYLKGTVSELALRRSDYAGVLERDGFETLATTMESRIAGLASAKAAR